MSGCRRELAFEAPAVTVTYHADTGGNDAYSAECSKCYRNSGECFETAEQARAWRCTGSYCQRAFEGSA